MLWNKEKNANLILENNLSYKSPQASCCNSIIYPDQDRNFFHTETFANNGNLHSEWTPFGSKMPFAWRTHPSSMCKLSLKNFITKWFTSLGMRHLYQLQWDILN